jgi:septal ring factor EnvC (AmiA/AmiB activator)
VEQELTLARDENDSLQTQTAGLTHAEAQASAKCAQAEERITRLEAELAHVLGENQTLKSQVETLSGPLAVTVSYAGPPQEVGSAESSPVTREQSFVLNASNTLPVQLHPAMRQNQSSSKTLVATTPAASLLGPTTSTVIDNRSMSPFSVQRPSGILGVPPSTPAMVRPSQFW